MWFWGGAALPDDGDTHLLDHDHAPIPAFYCDDSFADVLADCQGVECRSLASLDSTTINTDALVVDTRVSDALLAGDERGMQAAQHRILAHWLLPLQGRINAGESIEVSAYNEDGQLGLLNAEAIRLEKQNRLRRSLVDNPDQYTVGGRIRKFWQRFTGRP